MKLNTNMFGPAIGAVMLLAAIVGNACECPTAQDVAKYAIGSVTHVSGDLYDVELLIATEETGTFGQMTLVYDSGDLEFVSVEAGASLKNPPYPPDAFEGGGGIVLQWAGGFCGPELCEQQVLIARFERLDAGGGTISFNETPSMANSYCHILYDSDGDGHIQAADICFDGGSIPAAKATLERSAPTEQSQWGSVKQLYR